MPSSIHPRPVYTFAKRTADLVLSGFAILVLSPLLLVIALVLRTTGEREVIFRSPRVGKDYKTITMHKFVTMHSGSEKQGTLTAPHDPRVLPIGKVLRKTKLNELPQVFNIFLGRMTIVGPRPLPRGEVDQYPPHLRHRVYAGNKPGLTGMGSLFFRDEEELIAATGKKPERGYKEDILPIKAALEAWYAEHKSLRLDLAIVLLTAWSVVHPDSTPVVKVFRRARSFPQDELNKYERLLHHKRSHWRLRSVKY